MDLVTQVEFKAILKQNFEDLRAFIDNIQSRVKRDSLYQLEEIPDWAFYLEYLQSILTKFDASRVLAKFFIIQFFQKELKPLVKAQMKQRDRELNSWKELVEKVVDDEAKVGLLPISLIRDIDQ